MSNEIDWESALSSVNGDRSLLKLVIDAFLQESVQLEGQIVEAIANDDAKLLHRCGHTLKGGMMSLGASAWCGFPRQIEQLGGSGSTQGAQELANGLTGELPDLRDQLRAFSTGTG